MTDLRCRTLLLLVLAVSARLHAQADDSRPPLRTVPADVGTVAPGKRADLILVDANPLENAANVRRLSGVMLGGRWVDRARSDALRSEIVARLPQP